LLNLNLKLNVLPADLDRVFTIFFRFFNQILSVNSCSRGKGLRAINNFITSTNLVKLCDSLGRLEFERLLFIEESLLVVCHPDTIL
jgi:hypothetical protein